MDNNSSCGPEIQAREVVAKMKEADARKDFSGKCDLLTDLPRDVLLEVVKLEQANDRKEYGAYFTPENSLNDTKVYTSPSGKYRLETTHFKSTAGGWHLCQGRVFKKDSSTPLFEVNRNYGAFPFSWVEQHPNGHDYLVCGEDYQGATVLELDSAQRVDYLPVLAILGWGFCWGSHFPSPGKTLLAVEGCVWAGPYEIVIHDFSDPMHPPWPEVHVNQEDQAFDMWLTEESYRTKDEQPPQGAHIIQIQPFLEHVKQYILGEVEHLARTNNISPDDSFMIEALLEKLGKLSPNDLMRINLDPTLRGYFDTLRKRGFRV